MLKLTRFIFLFLVSAQSNAGELHSFITQNCEVASGAILRVDDSVVSILKLNGLSQHIPVRDVKSILISNYFDNPFPVITESNDLGAHLKKISVGDKNVFNGWPVRFVESLVVFLDTTGKLRIHEKDSITKIRPVKSFPGLQPTVIVPITIDFSGNDLGCSNLPGTSVSAVRPTRILNDQIKISQYLENLRQGFSELDNFEERTYLYARPLLFDQSTRFGGVFQPVEVERNLQAPIFFQWSTGTPFHFQSFNRFGMQAMEFSPYALSPFGFRSDLKAHLFHAHFAGDLRGLAGGQQLYQDIDSEPDQPKYGGTIEGQSGMNYILLMGVDYGRFSASAGYYYPTYLYRSQAATREVLASRRNYAFRGMYTTPKLRFRAVVSPHEFEATSVTDKVLIVDPGATAPSSFSLSGLFFRGGVDWDWRSDRLVSLDFLSNASKYKEMNGPIESSFEFNKTAFIASLRQDFGDYVGVRINVALMQLEKKNSGVGGVVDSKSETPALVGGQLEFIF